MKTILHTESSTGWGGQEMRIIQESRSFQKRGYRVLVASNEGSGIFREAEKQSIPVKSFSFNHINPMTVMRLVSFCREEKVDLIHTHSSVDSWIGGATGRFAGIPVVRSRHLSIPVKKNPLTRFLYTYLNDAIITSGEEIKRMLCEDNGYDKNRIFSVPAGVDINRFHPGVSAENFKKEFNIEEDDFVIGILAILRWWKGHRILIEAVQSIKKTYPRVKLLIAGNGPQEENLKKLIAEEGISDYVIMTGYREDTPEVCRTFDLMVLPSLKNEATSQVLPQAMAVGVPVIASTAGGMYEIIEDGVNGYLIPPNDVKTLENKIEWAINNREKLSSVTENAMKFVRKNLTFERQLNRTEAVYKKLLKIITS